MSNAEQRISPSVRAAEQTGGAPKASPDGFPYPSLASLGGLPAIHIPSVIVDLDTRRVVDANVGFAELTSQPPGELIGASFDSLVHDEDIAPLTKRFNRIPLNSDRPVVAAKRLKTAPAGYSFFHLAIHARHQPPGPRLAVIEVHEAAEEFHHLRRVLNRLHLAQNAGGVGVWDYVFGESFVYWSEMMFTHFGLPPNEDGMVTPDIVNGRLHPEDQTRLMTGFKDFIESNQREFRSEFRVVLPAGDLRWLENVAVLDRTEEGGPLRISGTLADVSERKWFIDALNQANARAEQERRLLDAVFDSLPAGVAITDAKGGVLRVNAMYAKIWGKAPVTRSVDDYVRYRASWVDAQRPVEPHEWASARAVQYGETVTGQILEIERFDGGHGIVYNSAAPVRDADGNIIGSSVSILDITALHRTQRALQENEKRLRELNASLETRVRERTAELQMRNDQLQKLAADMGNIEQRERKRLADILHDDLQQILVAAQMALSQVQKSNADDTCHDTVTNVVGWIEDALTVTRDLSRELRPPVLYAFGLVHALQWLARMESERFGLRVNIEQLRRTSHRERSASRR